MSIEDDSSFPLLNKRCIDNICLIKPLRSIFSGEQVRDFNRFLVDYKQQSDIHLIFDISQCEYASSEGLGSIAACRQWHSMKENRRFAVIIPDSSDSYIAELFSITGLDMTMREAIHLSLDSALNYVRQA